MEKRERLHTALKNVIISMGYPPEFGDAIADQVRTEKAMGRMPGYLLHAKPRSAEEIADEMLAICDDRDRWQKKKESEYYNNLPLSTTITLALNAARSGREHNHCN